MKANWISVNDGLPEENGTYIVTTTFTVSGREQCRRVAFMTYLDGWTAEDKDGSGGWKVIAWMDLPTVYTDPRYLNRQFVSAEAIYTGGNIYVYMGEIEDGVFFFAMDDMCYDVLFLDADPREADDDAFQPNWQREHTLKEYCDTDEVFDWFTKMYLLSFDASATKREKIIEVIDYKQYLKNHQ